MKKIGVLSLLLISVLEVQAQTAPPPPPVWTGNFGAGLALTSGNTNTKNFNVSFDTLRDPKKDTVIRMKAIYLRGDENGLLTVNRLNVAGRDEIKLSPKLFTFVQADYTKDTFKQIDYIVSPTGGIGYTFVHTDRIQFALDTGVGGIWERDAATATIFNGAVNASERFSWKFSKNATFTQSIDSLWKMNDFSDSLHNATVGLAASITSKTELKIQIIDSYKNLPPSPTVKKNDTTVVTAIVFKF